MTWSHAPGGCTSTRAVAVPDWPRSSAGWVSANPVDRRRGVCAGGGRRRRDRRARRTRPAATTGRALFHHHYPVRQVVVHARYTHGLAPLALQQRIGDGSPWRSPPRPRRRSSAAPRAPDNTNRAKHSDGTNDCQMRGLVVGTSGGQSPVKDLRTLLMRSRHRATGYEPMRRRAMRNRLSGTKRRLGRTLPSRWPTPARRTQKTSRRQLR